MRITVLRIALLLCSTALLVACQEGDNMPSETHVDFASTGAAAARAAACSQDYDTAARKGAGAEDYNATTLWSVSPYLVLVPSTGEGHVVLNVDAKHYDWLLYTTSDVELESAGGPDIVFNGPVQECPEFGLMEYGVHHTDHATWPLLLRADGLSRVHFYAGLAATPHSDPTEAGHAGHNLDGDSGVPDHGDH